MNNTLATHYKALCDEGKITWDEPQARAVEALGVLSDHLLNPPKSQLLSRFLRNHKSPKDHLLNPPQSSLLSRFLGNPTSPKDHLLNPPKSPLLSRLLKTSKPPKGIYLWGDVGRGKSFVMDLFFEHLREIPKKRVHFHVFMQSVHEQLQILKDVESVASKIASEAKVLCFDEFQVTNIADAMIMGRLFKGLFERGVVVVATSNVRPEKLYAGGLHRERFEPFIEILKDHVTSLELPGHQDYRRRKVEGRKRYFTPLGAPDTTEGMSRLWSDLVHDVEPEILAINAKGRTLILDRFAHGVAWTSFDHLCRQALGASDYIEMAQNIRILLLENIPQLTTNDQNEAMRLQTLVDVLYDEGVLIVASAAVEPDQLYLEGQGSESFKRTASRLYEMCYGTKS